MRQRAKETVQNGPTLMAKCQHQEQNNCRLATASSSDRVGHKHRFYHIYLVFCSGVLSGILSGILYWRFIWHSIWHGFSWVLSQVLSGNLSDTDSCILVFWQSIWHLSCHSSGPAGHNLRASHSFRFRQSHRVCELAMVWGGSRRRGTGKGWERRKRSKES